MFPHFTYEFPVTLTIDGYLKVFIINTDCVLCELGNESIHLVMIVGRNSSVCTATRYRVDGPGIESRWGRDFPHPSTPALRPTKPPIK